LLKHTYLYSYCVIDLHFFAKKFWFMWVYTCSCKKYQGSLIIACLRNLLFIWFFSLSISIFNNEENWYIQDHLISAKENTQFIDLIINVCWSFYLGVFSLFLSLSNSSCCWNWHGVSDFNWLSLHCNEKLFLLKIFFTIKRNLEAFEETKNLSIQSESWYMIELDNN